MEGERLMRVLLVEDVEVIRRGMMLSVPWMELGCTVVGDAGDGEEALELYRRLEPDIVITDIRLPKMDGLTFIQKAKETAPCEFLVISAYEDFRYAQTVIENAGRAYLLKPVDIEELKQVLKTTAAAIREKRDTKRIAAYLNEGQDNQFIRMLAMLTGESQHNQYMDRAVRYISAHYSEQLTLKGVAEVLGISGSYLTKLFKTNSDYTFLEILTVYRVKKAIELLQDTDMKVYEVAEAVGYHDTRYFSEIFDKYVGVSPSQYHNRFKEKRS